MIGGNIGWECPIGLGAPPSPPLVATISIATEIRNEAWATTYGYRWTCKGYPTQIKTIHMVLTNISTIEFPKIVAMEYNFLHLKNLTRCVH